MLFRWIFFFSSLPFSVSSTLTFSVTSLLPVAAEANFYTNSYNILALQRPPHTLSTLLGHFSFSSTTMSQTNWEADKMQVPNFHLFIYLFITLPTRVLCFLLDYFLFPFWVSLILRFSTCLLYFINVLSYEWLTLFSLLRVCSFCKFIAGFYRKFLILAAELKLLLFFDMVDVKFQPFCLPLFSFG